MPTTTDNESQIPLRRDGRAPRARGAILRLAVTALAVTLALAASGSAALASAGKHHRKAHRRGSAALSVVRLTGGASADGALRHVRVPAILRRIARCESGGNPRAVAGRYRGKYQFTRATWRLVGGRGDPARAPESEQDRRAKRLYRRDGIKPWPVCGRVALVRIHRIRARRRRHKAQSASASGHARRHDRSHG